VGWLPHELTNSEVSASAAEHSVEVLPLSRYAMTPLSRGALLLGYAGFDRAAIRAGVARLAAALDQVTKQKTNRARHMPQTPLVPHRQDREHRRR